MEVAQGIVGHGFIALGTEDETHRRILVFVCPVFARIVQIEIHLPGIGVGEFADFQIDDDEAPESPVEEQQVDAIPLVADPQPLLPGDEGELIPQLQQELLQVPDERLFQGLFGVLILEAQPGLFMTTCSGVRSSRPAGLFSFGLLDGLQVRLRRPHVREVPAGFGLERLATALMNSPG